MGCSLDTTPGKKFLLSVTMPFPSKFLLRHHTNKIQYMATQSLN